MTMLVDLDKLTVRIGTYRTGTAVALGDREPLAIARARRKEMAVRMVPLDAVTSKSRIVPGKYLIARKVDGEYTCLVYRDGEICTLNPYGTVRVGAAFHAEAALCLQRFGVKSAVIGGELYVARPDGRRARVHDVCRIARAPGSQADVDTLRFAAFAIYDLDGVDLSASPAATLARLREVFGDGKTVHPVETVEGDEKAVHARFRQWVEEEGEEGIVARSEAAGWFKIKPRHSLDLAVVGFSRGIEDRADRLHSLLLAIVRGDGSYHVVGRTGGGFSDAERCTLLGDLERRAVASSYAEVNSDRVAYRMIEPGLVAEISCLDVIVATSEGRSIDRPVIEWRAAERTWAPIRKLALASIISPQFVRLREDKRASTDETGADQLGRIVELPEVDVATAGIRPPVATVLRRAVAVKELKGRKLVRKLMLWQTNKDKVSAEHPAFFLLLTDYSPNRKTPLERDIRVSSSLDQLEAMWGTWHAQNFVKGWAVQ